jgi:hypothetical protein
MQKFNFSIEYDIDERIIIKYNSYAKSKGSQKKKECLMSVVY